MSADVGIETKTPRDGVESLITLNDALAAAAGVQTADEKPERQQQPTPPAQSSDNQQASAQRDQMMITSGDGQIDQMGNGASQAQATDRPAEPPNLSATEKSEPMQSESTAEIPPTTETAAAAAADAAPAVDPSLAIGVQLQYQQQQLQRHQEALLAQQRYLEQQQSYIQQLCALQERIRHETPETAARLLALRDAPVGRPNQWNYAQAPVIPAVSIAAPKSRLLPKEQVERLTQWFLNNILHPYPTKDELNRLVRDTGLTETQVTNWFNNARRRHKNLFNLPERAVRILHGWFSEHVNDPQPSADEVHALCQQIGLGVTAATVERWIAHARTLHKHLSRQSDGASVDSGSDSHGPETFSARSSPPDSGMSTPRTPHGARPSPTMSGSVTPTRSMAHPILALQQGAQPMAPALRRHSLPLPLGAAAAAAAAGASAVLPGATAGMLSVAHSPVRPGLGLASQLPPMAPQLIPSQTSASQPSTPTVGSQSLPAGMRFSGMHMMSNALPQMQLQLLGSNSTGCVSTDMAALALTGLKRKPDDLYDTSVRVDAADAAAAAAAVVGDADSKRLHGSNDMPL